MHRSSEGGKKLLHETLATLPTTTGAPGVTGTTGPPGCQPAFPTATADTVQLAGILEVPAIDVRAPVVQGLGDAQMNVAVGHDPPTPWPGYPGESIVEAHDVSYFSAIDTLKIGQEVTWEDACRTRTFKVVGTVVTKPGAPIPTAPGGTGLALITCYPTDALFWTSYRFMVETALVSTSERGSQPVAPVEPVEPATDLVVPAPADLVAEGLTLQDNSIYLGTL
ncbi:MAG TPA: sortase, partial [Acidimicrobiales bacterium]|nr:sortase [Acidimicrobiales bacterium]